MVHIVRPIWEKVGAANQLGRAFPPLTYGQQDADDLVLLEPAPRTVRGARDLLSVALQYGNAFGRGFQAAALKPADYFGNDDELYLMEDMATGEMRVSILWEWLHKQARFTADDAASGVQAGDPFTLAFFDRLMEEEYAKLQKAGKQGRPRRLEAHHAADRPRHRRALRQAPGQGALVHRPAQPQPEQPRFRARAGAHRGVLHRLRARRHPPDRQPGFRCL